MQLTELDSSFRSLSSLSIEECFTIIEDFPSKENICSEFMGSPESDTFCGMDKLIWKATLSLSLISDVQKSTEESTRIFGLDIALL